MAISKENFYFHYFPTNSMEKILSQALVKKYVATKNNGKNNHNSLKMHTKNSQCSRLH